MTNKPKDQQSQGPTDLGGIRQTSGDGSRRIPRL